MDPSKADYPVETLSENYRPGLTKVKVPTKGGKTVFRWVKSSHPDAASGTPFKPPAGKPPAPAPNKADAKKIKPPKLTVVKPPSPAAPPTLHDNGTAPPVFKPGAKERLTAVFGRELTTEHVRAIGCATPGSEVIVKSDRKNQVTITAYGNGVSASRTVSKTPTGKINVKNNSFYLRKDGTHDDDNLLVQFRGKAPAGVTGTEIFAKQVDTLRSLGADKISTFGIRGFGDGGENGYYTWPRLGYSGAADPGVLAKLPEPLKSGMAKKKNVADLFALPGGPEFWKEHGTHTDLTFDLKPGSKNGKALDEYRTKKAGVK
ncbi:MAG: hypothetical protein ACRC7O_06080 [Fimbriiglobus sp.]